MAEYQDLSEKQIQAGYWFVTHKLQLKKMLIAFLFFSNLAVWGYVLFSLAIAFGSSYANDRQMKVAMVFDTALHPDAVTQAQPQSIQVREVVSYFSGDKRLDAVARIVNPNQYWGATFDYRFITTQGPLPLRKGFILPGREKFLFDLDVEADRINSVTLSHVVWSRHNTIEDILAMRELFEYQDIVVTPKGIDSLDAHSVRFTVHNKSTYNFFQPQFQVHLKRSGATVAVQQVSLSGTLRSGESREIDVRWPEDIGVINSVVIIPDINYLDPQVYTSH